MRLSALTVTRLLILPAWADACFERAPSPAPAPVSGFLSTCAVGVDVDVETDVVPDGEEAGTATFASSIVVELSPSSEVSAVSIGGDTLEDAGWARGSVIPSFFPLVVFFFFSKSAEAVFTRVRKA